MQKLHTERRTPENEIINLRQNKCARFSGGERSVSPTRARTPQGSSASLPAQVGGHRWPAGENPDTPVMKRAPTSAPCKHWSPKHCLKPLPLPLPSSTLAPALHSSRRLAHQPGSLACSLRQHIQGLSINTLMLHLTVNYSSL